MSTDTMSTGTSPNIAYSASLWSYQTGRVDRKQYLVIRIRDDTNDAAGQLVPDDTTGAGKEWNDVELAVQNIPISSLVVVVGEAMPKDSCMDNFRIITGEKSIPSVTDTMTVFPVQENACVVVRLVATATPRLFALFDKKNGVCCLTALPSDVDIAYYSEWTAGAY